MRLRLQRVRECLAIRFAPWLIPTYTCKDCGEKRRGPSDYYMPQCSSCFMDSLGGGRS